MPRWPWFVAAGVVAVAGLAASWFYAAPRVAAVDADMKRVPIPGSATIELAKPGAYTIFLEQQGSDENPPPPVRATVKVFRQDADTPIPLSKPSYESSYTIHDRHGVAVLTFSVEQPASYRVATSLQGGGPTSGAVLAIGLGTMAAMFKTLGLAIAIAGVGFAAAFAMAFFGGWWKLKVKPE